MNVNPQITNIEVISRYNQERINVTVNPFLNKDGKSAYQSYLDTTDDNPVLTEEEWAKHTNHQFIDNLPDPLEPNTIYFVRSTGEIWQTDSAGVGKLYSYPDIINLNFRLGENNENKWITSSHVDGWKYGYLVSYDCTLTELINNTYSKGGAGIYTAFGKKKLTDVIVTLGSPGAGVTDLRLVVFANKINNGDFWNSQTGNGIVLLDEIIQTNGDYNAVYKRFNNINPVIIPDGYYVGVAFRQTDSWYSFTNNIALKFNNV